MDTKDEDDEDELRRTSVHDHGELTYLLRGTHCMNAEQRPCSEIEAVDSGMMVEKSLGAEGNVIWLQEFNLTQGENIRS